MPSRFAPYKNALQALSNRTGTPLSSLILSFAVLHEITAIAPVVGIFYGARTLGIGERVVSSIAERTDNDGYVQATVRGWVDEGQQWAQRVGRRYGVFGFEKRTTDSVSPPIDTSHIAGDVANAIFAYGVGKALLPVRIGLSLYLSPVFSRRIVEPIRLTLLRPFRRKDVI
ncbi:hypothetical protein BJ138DRAFT_1150929 [Hygrophoropsis aurantiaca]|uniref:Uncharacterized protein n=1 Tax=Hygrophoropsis aurantiaca TaxID=72124 RepID=A0ACB8AE28_9AGAM|nr:hypothetical protein BJ138DRAFT_1150929 [Hygrophoropsis aurantiaca]